MAFKPSHRRKARHYAVQAIYQWQMSGNAVADIENQFIETINPNKVEVPYFLALLRGTLTHLSNLDEQLTPYIDRDVEEIDPVERAVLRLAAFELLERQDIPYKVVINEALELAKVFGAEDGHKYVNGVLDKVAKVMRPLEVRT
ncbi:transcription antitermination factor NusB [Pleionea litopenaei]|uniref:Transcription antitermination protein NusB n=1 Tax=Pleionea litopenaei TaxID=3070815 RepID=A0AA51RS66_9GAMM|nr:transcription antitermination factor NusB [Pleionea sp. HL-JVS1]WMS86673.1 transcription antitermination factor NusB [Pleionea sp. HL-JVS1]